MRKKGGTLAVFDFDRTVTKRGTFTPFLLFAARAEPWRYAYLLPGGLLGLFYLAGIITRKRLKELVMDFFLAGKTRSEIEALAAAFTARLLAKGVHAKALETLHGHQEKGHKVGLATASMDFYVAHVTRALKLDFEISTRSVFDAKQRLVPHILGENCYGDAKAARLAELIKKENPEEVWFYSDHATDLPSFDLADVKVAVNPPPRLAARASGAGWKVVWWD
ncbi:MAG TPA: HAD-IB family hydrolase [Sphingomonadales bacterium]|nr:HAD-IB family hydrolase [Sphingomonadales bacterium]